jgi:hypothetical protein
MCEISNARVEPTEEEIGLTDIPVSFVRNLMFIVTKPTDRDPSDEEENLTMEDILPDLTADEPRPHWSNEEDRT